ncbi:hypothetical protein A0H81_05580 [Grifola frondosa]|uniref:Uncharacterized protein n=1 Tax=Grifola frondosa TaxID=5627 RepID=A0A1C7MCP9_GRIFR|nr:hypothetical protein A0H81_05580 [Grifola frondosa]
MAVHSLIYCILASLAAVRAVTVYSQQPLAPTSTNVASGAIYTGLKAYDPTVLNPPPLPNPLPATEFGIQLASNANNVAGLSIPLSGAFFGFSIEMSVANQVSEYPS